MHPTDDLSLLSNSHNRNIDVVEGSSGELPEEEYTDVSVSNESVECSGPLRGACIRDV